MNILLIEDDAGLVELITAMLKELGLSVMSATSGAEVLAYLEKQTPDLMLLDYSLPDINGEELIKVLNKQQTPLPPFIITTGQGDERIAVDMMKLGARDYLVKGAFFLEKLPDVIKRVVKEIENEEKLKQAEEAQKESKERFRELFDTINSGVAIYKVINDGKSGRDYIIQDFNKMALKNEGLKKEDVIGKSLFDLRPNIEEYGLISIFRKVWKTGEPAFFPAKIYVDDNYSNYYENRVFQIPSGEIVAVFDDVTDKENASAKIKESQERFNLAMLASKDGLYDWNLVTNTIYYSPGWKSMLGYSDEELPNDFSVWENLTKPEHAEQSWKMQRELINKQRDRFELEVKMKHKNGHWVDVLSRANAVFDESGKAVRIIGTHIDITERKRKEEELAQSEKRYRTLYTNTPALLHSFDIEGRIQSVSNRWLEKFGYERDEVIGHKSTEFLTEKSRREAIEHYIPIFFKEGFINNVPYQFVTKGGDVLDVLLSAISEQDENGNVIRSLAVIEDVTERKLYELQLLESEKKYRNLINLAQEGIWVIDKNSVTTFANPSMAKILGYTAEEMIGKSLFDFMDEAGVTLANENLERRKAGLKEQHDFEFICKNGGRIFCTMVTAPILDAAGDYQGAIAGIIDITERKQAEEGIKRSQSLLQQAEEISNQGAWEWDIVKDEWIFSENWLHIHGCRLSGISRKELMVIAYAEDAPKVEEAFQAALNGGAPYNLEYRIVRKNNGEVRYVRAKGNIIFSESGQAVKMYGVTADITDVKQAEESNRLHSEMLANIADGVYLVKLDDGKILDANPRFTEMFGYDEDELIGKHVSVLNAPTDKNPQETAKEIIDVVRLTGRWQGEIKNIKKDKTLFWCSANASLFNHSKYGNVLVTVNSDITSQKLAEEKLRDSEEKYKALYKNAPLSYQSLNEDGTFKDINPFWLQTLGYERHEVIGEKYSDFIHPDWKPHFEKNFPAFKKRGYVSDVQYKIRHKEGHYLDIAFEGCIGYNPDGSFRQTYCVFQDITARKQAEEKLKVSVEQFRAIFEQSPIAIEVYDKKGKLIDLNQQALSMFGVDDEKHVLGFDLWADPNLSSEKTLSLKNGKPVFISGNFDFELVKKHKLYPTRRSGIMYMDIYAIPIMQKNEVSGYLLQIIEVTERKLAEENLKVSEEKFRSLYSNSPFGLLICCLIRNNNGEAIDFIHEEGNVAIEANTGLKQHQLVGKKASELLDFKTQADFTKKYERVVKSGEPVNYIQYFDVYKKTLQVSAFALQGDKFIISFSDISEQKNTEKELSESLIREQSLADIVRNTPIAIASGYPDGRLDNCNNAFETLTGYSAAELNKINWNKELTPAHWNEMEEEALQKLNSENNFIQYEKEYIHKNGTIFPVELFVYGRFDDNKNLLHYTGFIIDITERKQFLEKLQDRNEYIESVMDKMPIGFALNTIDDGEVKYLNTSFEEIYGWSQNILTNTSIFFEKVFPDPEYREKMKKQIVSDMESGDPKRMVWKDLKIVTSTGEVRFVHAHNIPLIDQNLMISTVQDTTQRKLAEDEITKHRENLEELVRERTKNLEEKNKELERFNDLFVNRELRIRELKEKIKEMEGRL